MTSTDNLMKRESRIWAPFSFGQAGLTDAQRQERVLLFGLYSRAYLNGAAFLNAYKASELEMIVADYEQKMAALDAEEQQAVFDILTKRYLSEVDRAVHDEKMKNIRGGIDDDHAMMDARWDALQADYKAIEGLTVRLAAREKEIEARIQVLKAQLNQEDVNRQHVDIEIANRELDLARKGAESASKDLQISRADLDIGRAELSALEAESRLLGQDLQIAEKDLDIAHSQLQLDEKELQEVRAQHETLRVQMRTVEAGIREVEHRRTLAQVGVDKANTEARIARTESLLVDERQAELGRERAKAGIKESDIRIAGIETDILRTEAQKANQELDKVRADREVGDTKIRVARTEEQIAQTPLVKAEGDMAEVRADVAEERLDLHRARLDLARDRKGDAEDEKSDTARLLQAEKRFRQLRLEEQGAQHQRALTTLDARDIELVRRIDLREAKINAEQQVLNTDDRVQPRMDDKSVAVQRERENAANTSRRAAVDAASILASADILSTMTHSIGRG